MKIGFVFLTTNLGDEMKALWFLALLSLFLVGCSITDAPIEDKSVIISVGTVPDSIGYKTLKEISYKISPEDTLREVSRIFNGKRTLILVSITSVNHYFVIAENSRLVTVIYADEIIQARSPESGNAEINLTFRRNLIKFIVSF